MVRPPDMSNLCVICKGARNLCGRPRCPILARVEAMIKVSPALRREEIFGPTPPSFFVGRIGYPSVRAGPLATPIELEDPSLLEDTRRMFGLSLEEILNLRTILVRGKRLVNVRKLGEDRILERAREIAMAKKPVDVEMRFDKPPVLRVTLSDYVQPMGPSANIERLMVAENPRVDRPVEKVVYDYDLKAERAVIELYESGIHVDRISRIFSAGLLGVERNRRLVPTRWSITAIDDIISKYLLDQVRKFPEISEYRVYRSNYLDNRFAVLLIPSRWFFEQIEAWYPGSIWVRGFKPIVVSDHEGYFGRKDYADNVGGAYYAARLAVLEYLRKIRRQAGVIIFREIGQGYYFPVGVWQIRENVRNAMRSGFEKFESLEDALRSIGSFLRIPIDEWIKNSFMLRNLMRQRRITDFMG